MNLVLVPTNMISGPLAERLGFSTFFLVVMVASVPSVWAAWRAPFPLSSDSTVEDPTAPEDHVVVTVDDPTRLTTAERAVQLIAGRASIYAMLNILVILLLDARLLASLQDRSDGPALFVFALLLGSAGLKLFLASKTFGSARLARAEAALTGEGVYLRNAGGAVVATYVCGIVGLGVLAFGAHLAF